MVTDTESGAATSGRKNLPTGGAKPEMRRIGSPQILGGTYRCQT